ncbi:PCRF domain-containing protein, partial [Candidatus Ruminimicrobium bovinum]|uniref:PCRF domain-containing protein n=1 Tax=Candidatus Ruminimicrobium bovinum TaxID=3242779 RepID=UPI0039B945A7
MLEEIKEKINNLKIIFDIDNKIKELDSVAVSNDFWLDQNKAKKTMEKLNDLKDIVEQWSKLNDKTKDLLEIQNLLLTEKDESLEKELQDGIMNLEKEINKLDIKTKLSSPHDKNNAIVSIHAGAGGTESCDWVSMLVRMYSMWAENKGFSIDTVDILDGDEAGIKSITFIIKGEYAYGYMQAEMGVHRLVRISPFDANKRRHTSF